MDDPAGIDFSFDTGISSHYFYCYGHPVSYVIGCEE